MPDLGRDRTSCRSVGVRCSGGRGWGDAADKSRASLVQGVRTSGTADTSTATTVALMRNVRFTVIGWLTRMANRWRSKHAWNAPPHTSARRDPPRAQSRRTYRVTGVFRRQSKRPASDGSIVPRGRVVGGSSTAKMSSASNFDIMNCMTFCRSGRTLAICFFFRRLHCHGIKCIESTFTIFVQHVVKIIMRI